MRLDSPELRRPRQDNPREGGGGGRVVETGAPAKMLDAPDNPRVREFMSKILRH